MDRETALYMTLGAAVLFLIYSRTDEGSAVVAKMTDSVASTVRGIRNNNPGNIRRTSDAWQGLSPVQPDSAFFTFESMPYGVRAMVVILKKYRGVYGLRTVRDIINRWAPPVENNTSAYVRYVADYVGTLPDTPLDFTSGDTLFYLVRAIIAYEVGRVPALLVSDADVREGMALA